MSATKTEYSNLKFQKDFNYYFSPNMINGIMIELSADALFTNRKLYGIDDLVLEVGGLITGFTIFISILFCVFQTWPLEKYLIEKLYKKRVSKKTKNASELGDANDLISKASIEIH